MGAGVTSSLLMFLHDSVADGVTGKYKCSSRVGGETWGDEQGRSHGTDPHFPSFALLGPRALVPHVTLILYLHVSPRRGMM